mgnify:FL=1
MKKILIIAITFILALNFAACGTKQTPGGDKPGNDPVLNESLEDILKKIYETAELSDNFREFVENGLQTTVVTSDRTAFYLGKEDIEFEEALASEPIMMPSAYELTLVRVKEDADVEKIKNEIRENVDPNKWICVGVDPENVIVDNIGNVIIVIMSDYEGKALHDAFLALKGQK